MFKESFYSIVIPIFKQCITSFVSEIVTFRVSRRLKERMEALDYINWSELLGNYVEKVVKEEEERLKPTRDMARVMAAVEEMDRLANVAGASGWSGSEEVVRWRRRRYPYLTPA